MAALNHRQRFWSVGSAAALLLWVLLTQPTHASSPGEPWQAPLRRDHPLTGRIWDVGRAS